MSTALSEILTRCGLTPEQLQSVGVSLPTPPRPSAPQATKRPAISRPPRPSGPVILVAPEIVTAARRGWRLHPLRPKDKLPCLKEWQRRATSNLRQIESWAREYRGCNWGAVCGPESGFFAVDVDNPDAMRKLEDEHGPVPEGLVNVTSRGYQLLYAWPEDATVRPATNCPHDGIDVRGQDSYIVIPPSVHPSGHVYRYSDDSLPIPVCPAWLLALILHPVRAGAQARKSAPAAGGKIVAPNRIPHLRSRLGTMLKRGMDPTAIEAALLAENLAKCDPPEDEAKIRGMVADMTRRYPAGTMQPTALESFLSDPRPKLRLRGDNRLLSDVASELGPHLAQVLYTHAGEVVGCQGGSLHPISAQQFRTLAERYVTFYRVRSANASTVQVGGSLDEGDARGVLASPQFLECLKPIRHLNVVRIPVLRSNGRIELLPAGYDTETSTLTDVAVSYADDMAFPDAVEVIRDLFGEFQFSDGERSRSVAVAALVGLFAKQLVKPGELRPAFTVTKNAEGSGASTLVGCAIIPVLGDLPTGVKAVDDDETRKSITSAIRYGREILLLDNTKGKLNSPSLEAFVTAATWTDRLLGSNENVTGENNVTVFVTSNGLTITPDWRRRSLFAELHLSEERAEDKVYRRPLSTPILKAMRPQILAACWSLIRHWDEQGRTQPSRSHSAFPAWASIIGGIVEAAGFACPFATANIAVVADEDGQSMRQLVAAMTPSLRYSMSDLVEVCRGQGIFESLVGASDADWGRAQRTTLGRLLSRYNDRIVGDCRFFITGTGHSKRFLVSPLELKEKGGSVE